MSYNWFEGKAMKKLSKMSRQLQLFYEVHKIVVDRDTIISPDELMYDFGITRRMLQRDLKDFRDSGLINLKYDKAADRYVISEKPLEHEEIAARRLSRYPKHLHTIWRNMKTAKDISTSIWKMLKKILKKTLPRI